jgi:hypothetical protein
LESRSSQACLDSVSKSHHSFLVPVEAQSPGFCSAPARLVFCSWAFLFREILVGSPARICARSLLSIRLGLATRIHTSACAVRLGRCRFWASLEDSCTAALVFSSLVTIDFASRFRFQFGFHARVASGYNSRRFCFSSWVLCFSCVGRAQPWFILPLLWFLCVDFEFCDCVWIVVVRTGIVLESSD